MTLAKLDAATMAQQLAHPDGDLGVEVGLHMNETNAPLYQAVLPLLEAAPGDQLIEIGFGNGRFIPDMLALAPGLTYTGIDVSETMVAEAAAFNREAVAAKSVNLAVASVEAVPYTDQSFQRALAVNVIYFWPDLLSGFREIRRVMKTNGRFLIVAGTPRWAAKAPFMRYGFKIYAAEEVTAAACQAGFDQVEVTVFQDAISALDGSGLRQREFNVFAAST